MKPLEIIIGAVVLLISIVLIVICMMQEQAEAAGPLRI